MDCRQFLQFPTSWSPSGHPKHCRFLAALREAETVGIPYEVDETRPTAKHAAKPENRRVIVAHEAVGTGNEYEFF